MSWDAQICRVEGNPFSPDCRSLVLGTAKEIKERLSSVWPSIVWHNLENGMAQTTDYALEISLAFAQVSNRLHEAAKQLPKIDHSIFSNLAAKLDEFKGGLTLDSDVQNISIQVRGGGSVIAEIVQLCKSNGWQVIDWQTAQLIDLESPSSETLNGWQHLRDRIQ